MAGTVAGVACDFVKGDARDLQSTVELWKVPGVNGYGAHKLGLGDSDFRFTLVKFGTNAEVRVWYAQMQVYKGNLVEVVNDQQNVFSYCLVTSMTIIKQKRVHRPSANYAYRGEIEIEGVQIE